MANELHIMVCVTKQKTCERLIREGIAFARAMRARLSVVHVARSGEALLGNPSESDALDYLFRVSREAGAEMAVLRSEDVLETLAAYAEEQEVSALVVGASNVRSERDMGLQLIERLPQMDIRAVYTDEAC